MQNKKIKDYTNLFSKNIPNTYGYRCEKLIFTSREQEKEWEDLEPAIKNHAMQHLEEYANKMSLKVSVEMLCHVINDLNERIKKLEGKNAQ